ncbi:cytochrome P450 [Sungkyunkwania multivorans]|uniref:Cytochrome P450 n=1 Tax=Sungkyunkwania multivorans TaxID=1173618 RepID=A0ABW3CVZ5_9FLAO
MAKRPPKIKVSKFFWNIAVIAKNPIPFHRQCFSEAGDSFMLNFVFKKPIFLSRDAEVARHILQKNHKNYHKSKLQTVNLAKYIGHGLLTSNGDHWLRQRRLIQPAFHKTKMEGLLGIMKKTIQAEIQRLPMDDNVPLYPLMNKLAFQVVAQALFNYDSDSHTFDRLQKIIEELQAHIVKEIRLPFKKWWFKLSGKVKYHEHLAKESRAIILTLIEERRASKDTHDDLLDLLLNVTYEDGSNMSNDTLIDEILILFVAGHETTANTLTFTLSLLAQNPNELNKLRQEIDDIDENIDLISLLAKLSYAKQCLRESMRLYPPAWIIDRVALADDTVGDFAIEEGTLLGISFYELHRNPKYWSDPSVFDPERFSPQRMKEQFPGSYLPFGAGPRLCIGNGFAIYEMLLTLYTIIKGFDIKTEQKDIVANPLITLKPVGAEVTFTKRN